MGILFLKYLDDFEKDRQAAANLDELKQSLLQKAFTGQLAQSTVCEEMPV